MASCVVLEISEDLEDEEDYAKCFSYGTYQCEMIVFMRKGDMKPYRPYATLITNCQICHEGLNSKGHPDKQWPFLQFPSIVSETATKDQADKQTGLWGPEQCFDTSPTPATIPPNITTSVDSFGLLTSIV
ncbi:hypothetical protein TNCV_3351261 [Trichonephila clavipes]|nr:hypothetical protein TNCV_3351261 [Trichonephila clavipes]